MQRSAGKRLDDGRRVGATRPSADSDMADWLDELEPDERSRWDEFVEHFRREAIGKIAGSSAFVSLVPSPEDLDVKFAVELGAAIMLDKPILVLAPPGVRVPDNLRAVASEVVVADVDLESDKLVIEAAVRRLLDRAVGS